MMTIGPFSIKTVGVFAAVLLAWLVTRSVAKRWPNVSHKQAGGVLLDTVFWGLVAARLAYIARWWPDYLAAPMSMLAIGDGGFVWWVGVLTVFSLVWWRTRSTRILRGPVFVGVIIGVAAWLWVGAIVNQLQQPLALPTVALVTLDEQPASLISYKGRPTVVNLWATWCPPCRREMPVFEQAQAEFPEVAIVMINQGESAQQARDFLESEGLALSDVLLDPWSRTMQEIGARVLPTTLFFDAQGQLVDSHVGELSMASFKSKMSNHFAQSAQPVTGEE